ncbi:TonB-dependent receptor [Sphingomonas solaris]|uniref:TonB-dependent receptor n=2 Tax=Alterirhizorhabdus solaris TaxID=2529389 RepID=A0A558R561_9SPHN|nr:TonB-dependent receptor [Sphingomonas solaris]
MDIALRSSTASLALGLMIVSSQALAQAAPPSTVVPVTTGEATGSAADNEIVVTGSRIARPDLESSSPINVVSAADIALKSGSANIENVLNDLPQVTATQSGTSNNPGGGVATVNLRNLGSQRTLVLVNGRRYMSYDVNQVVDLNTIPSSLIERVDVLTGGASAVYGSDAVGGVVNFVLKHDFSGVELNSSYELTERGDGQIFDINGTIGSNFDDNRGNVTLYAGYTKRRPTLAGDRSFSRDALSDVINADGSRSLIAAGGSPSVPEGRITVAGLGAALGQRTGPGCATAAALNNQVFAQNGSTRCYTAADGYNFAPINYLQVPQERFIVSAQAQYEISEHFTPYMEAQFANNRVVNQLAATPITSGTPFAASPSGTIGAIPLQVNSPFFAPALQNALRTLDTDGNGYVNGTFNFRTTQIGPRANFDERNAFRVLGGLKGDIGAGFSYDGYYMYSRTKNSQRQLGNVQVDRFIDAVTTSGTGASFGCASGNTGCAPANIFGLNNLSQAAIDYISVGATNLEEYTTQVASVAVTNPSVFDLGAGGVGIAFGAEYRSERGRIDPDTNLASGNVAGFNPGQATAGGYHTRDFFGEINVPLLRDNIVHRLNVNAAARQTKYSNAPGNVFTWAAGAELAPIRDITFRGNYQRAIRGPSVNELFLGNTVSFAGNADRCGTAAAVPAGQLRDICLAQGVPATSLGDIAIQDPNNVNPVTFLGGNSQLREEKADNWTAGVVVQPSFVPRLTFTVDYYSIKIKNAIFSGVGTQTIGDQCFGGFNQAFCSLIQRNINGEIETFSDRYLNSGGLKNRGIDVTGGYSMPLSGFLSSDAKLSFSFSGTRLLKYDITPVAGTTYECEGAFGLNCGVPTPKWRHSLRTTFGVQKASLSVQWRYLGKVRDDNPDITYATERLKAQNYFDFTASFEATENFTLNAGVSNAFDKRPPLSASGQNGGNGEQSNTYPTAYDVLGRSFFVSGKMSF